VILGRVNVKVVTRRMHKDMRKSDRRNQVGFPPMMLQSTGESCLISIWVLCVDEADSCQPETGSDDVKEGYWC